MILDKIKKFLIEKKYEGRRLRPLMDEKEVDFVARVIKKIIEQNPNTIYEYEYRNFDPDETEHPYVDMAYYTPIEDYLTHHDYYNIVYDIPCPHCKENFVPEDHNLTYKDLKSIKKCNNCQKEFDLFEESPGLFNIPENYLDRLDVYTKLVKKDQ